MQLPKGKSLYDILELEKKNVDQDENLIKKAYRRLALRYHPDKQGPKGQTENTTQHFQLVGFAYSILNDPSKRKHYDLTGSLDSEESFLSGDKDWTDFFKELWQGIVSEETIAAHALKYQGSDEEKRDVLKYYTNCKGNMDHILAHVEHSNATDVPRFIDIIKTSIQDDKLESYPSFAKTTTKSAQLRRIQREKVETAAAQKAAEKRKAEKDSTHDKDERDGQDDEQEKEDDDGLDSLREMMKARQSQRKSKMDEMLAAMEEKATKKTALKGKSSASESKRSSTSTTKSGKVNQKKRQHEEDDNDEHEAPKTRKKATTTK